MLFNFIDENLDELINLIDHDSDDDFIDQLYNTQEQSNNAVTDANQDVIDTITDGVESKTSQDQVSPENMSSMFKVKINPLSDANTPC